MDKHPMGAGAPNMLRGGEVTRDTARLFEPPQDADPVAHPAPIDTFTDAFPDEPGWMVPLPVWAVHQHALRARQHPVGIRVMPDDDISALASGGDGPPRLDPRGIAFIAIVFPVYTDGRGFSLAHQLRREYGWQGEMRAVGDVLIDTVHYLARCGFDCFVLKDGHDPWQAFRALDAFTRPYQRAYPALGLER